MYYWGILIILSLFPQQLLETFSVIQPLPFIAIRHFDKLPTKYGIGRIQDFKLSPQNEGK